MAMQRALFCSFNADLLIVWCGAILARKPSRLQQGKEEIVKRVKTSVQIERKTVQTAPEWQQLGRA
jgi:hypothetical protein